MAGLFSLGEHDFCYSGCNVELQTSPDGSTRHPELGCKQMKLHLLGRALFVLTFTLVISSLGWSDSLQLKDGHHYYGKYAGGTEGVLAFQTEGSVQYFSVSDVVLLVFGESGEQAISPLRQQKKTPSVELKPHTSKAKGTATRPRLVRVSDTKTVAY